MDALGVFEHFASQPQLRERVANFVNNGPKHKATTTTPSTTN